MVGNEGGFASVFCTPKTQIHLIVRTYYPVMLLARFMQPWPLPISFFSQSPQLDLIDRHGALRRGGQRAPFFINLSYAAPHNVTNTWDIQYWGWPPLIPKFSGIFSKSKFYEKSGIVLKSFRKFLELSEVLRFSPKISRNFPNFYDVFRNSSIFPKQLAQSGGSY